MFEHHTGMLDADKLESLLLSLADGTIRGEDVFNDEGHGALMYDPTPLTLGEGDYDVVITGPRRNMFTPAQAGSPNRQLATLFPGSLWGYDDHRVFWIAGSHRRCAAGAG